MMRVNRDFFDSKGEALSSAQTVPADRVEQTLIFIFIFLFFLFTLKKLVFFPIVVRATYSAGTETKRQKMRSNIILSNQHLTM